MMQLFLWGCPSIMWFVGGDGACECVSGGGCVYIFACAFDSQRLRSVFPSITFLLWVYVHVMSVCMFICEYMCAVVHEWISEVNFRCWSSSSTVIETRTLLLVTAVNGRRAGVSRNSLVSISHLAVCMLVLQMWTSHTPWGGLWGSETQVPMLVHQGICYVSHLPRPHLDRVSNWACSSQIWLDWLAIKLQICLISTCQVLRFQGWPLLVFYLGAGDSNSDPHAFK